MPTAKTINLRNSLLDAGALPVENLAKLALRESCRPRQIYQVHRWFARRSGTAFRALLTAAFLPPDEDFWRAYYEGVDLRGVSLIDPFVGGGTSVVEALRLGANVIGVDVDAVACSITRFETRAHTVGDLTKALETLKNDVGSRLARFYRTQTPDGEREVLHYFWVQVVKCRNCHQVVEAHPHFQLAYESEGTHQWVFCSNCHKVQVLDRDTETMQCPECGTFTEIQRGPVKYGRLTCPHCGNKERLVDVAKRTGQPPQWRLFAMETLEAHVNRGRLPMTYRRFRPTTQYDQTVFEAAVAALKERVMPNGALCWIPERQIPRQDRTDDRIIQYGYSRYRELFNPRQLLHLSYLAEAIDRLDEPFREALALAFSDHLVTNCMMTHYAFGWRRLAPLFSVRAFRHVTRPVEINPWLDGVGRGTFPNAVRQVMAAVTFARSPKEPTLDGGFRSVSRVESCEGPSHPSIQIVHGTSEDLSFIPAESIDIALTDPPYFDNIVYSELSDFFLPWLQQFGLASPDPEARIAWTNSLAAKGRDEEHAKRYQVSLGKCIQEVARVLKPDGRLVFTYQHSTAEAWNALGHAFRGTPLRPIQVFPLRGDGNAGLHTHEGSSKWDMVFVFQKSRSVNQPNCLIVSESAVRFAIDHCRNWARRLAQAGFRHADYRNLYRATLVATALGLFPVGGSDSISSRSLIEWLRLEPHAVENQIGGLMYAADE